MVKALYKQATQRDYNNTSAGGLKVVVNIYLHVRNGLVNIKLKHFIVLTSINCYLHARKTIHKGKSFY